MAVTYTNFVRSRILVAAGLFLFLVMLAVDVGRLLTGKWPFNAGYPILFYAHLGVIAVLIAYLVVARCNAAGDAAQIRPIHHRLVNATAFGFLLAMVPITAGDILVSGSMAAYLGGLFALAALLVISNRSGALLFAGNMVIMLAVLILLAWRFDRHLEIQMINLVNFTVIGFILSRVLFFYSMQDFEHRLIIEQNRRELERLAATDPLTGILNRRRLMDILGMEIDRATRYGRPLSLVLFDLDHFKGVNDRYGHQTGDAVLVDIADRVAKQLRNTDHFARWGGEEFIVVCPETGAAGVRKVAESLRDLIAQVRDGGPPPVTASLGAAVYQAGEGVDAMIKRADVALYQAKQAGRHRCVYASAETPSDVPRFE